MTGLIDWRLESIHWSTVKHVNSLDSLVKQYGPSAARIFRDHINILEPRHRYQATKLYAILLASRRRSKALLDLHQDKLAWALTNCVPAGGNWRGLNLREPGNYCRKIVCPWCWSRKVSYICSALNKLFPEGCSSITVSRVQSGIVYDDLLRKGFLAAARNRIKSILYPKYLWTSNYRCPDTLAVTYYLPAGTSLNSVPLKPVTDITDSVISNYTFQDYFFIPDNYNNIQKYLDSTYKSRSFSERRVAL